MRSGYGTVAGLDEAGRGPLAGPVVAAAVVFSGSLLGLGIKDSKKLSPARRGDLARLIYRLSPAVGVGVAWPCEIDRTDILKASLGAMARALLEIRGNPPLESFFLLVDGPHEIPVSAPQKAIVSGDSLSVSIAAASIIAKTTRDSIMSAYHRLFPEYDFARNKGYPTKDHITRLGQNGLSPIHRRTFRPCGAGISP